MRLTLLALSVVLVTSSLAVGQELTKEQMGPWSALEEQIELDAKRDWEATRKFLHPKACLWTDAVPAPISMKGFPYYTKLRDGQDEVVAHHLVPVSVVVVDDVAIINFYLHVLTQTEDGEQVERVLRGHNTWKKENGRWLLLANYNTRVEKEEDD